MRSVLGRLGICLKTVFFYLLKSCFKEFDVCFYFCSTRVKCHAVLEAGCMTYFATRHSTVINNLRRPCGPTLLKNTKLGKSTLWYLTLCALLQQTVMLPHFRVSEDRYDEIKKIIRIKLFFFENFRTLRICYFHFRIASTHLDFAQNIRWLWGTYSSILPNTRDYRVLWNGRFTLIFISRSLT